MHTIWIQGRRGGKTTAHKISQMEGGVFAHLGRPAEVTDRCLVPKKPEELAGSGARWHDIFARLMLDGPHWRF